jgi:hypothetical protein
MRLKGLTFAVAPAVAFLVARADAVGTRTFELDSLEKLSGGDLKGVAITSDGVVRAGWTLGSVPIEGASAVWTALTLADGSTLLGTSPEGKVFKIAGDQATLFADTKTIGVTSLVQAQGGAIFAGSISEGKVLRLSQGKVETLATLPDASNVWALALDKSKSALFAATGPEGKVFRVELSGAASVYFKSDETNLVSLAIAENGDLYAGSSGKGLLYRITGPGRATVLYDFPGDPYVSVRAVATAKNGVVYAIANEESEPPEPPKRSSTAGRTPAGPTTGSRPKPGKGSLYRFDSSGRPERMMHHDDFHYMALALDEAGHPYVGTGAEGRVYTVDDAHVVTLIADTDERQVGALGVAARGGLVASSDPAVFHRILGHGGADAVWTSKVLDAGLRARFGVLTWRGTGPLELSTRTGNTQSPDATWTGWSVPLGAASPVASAPARYVQVRARWGRDPNATLSDVIVPFVTENVRPVVLEIGATPKGTPAHDSKEGVPASGGEPPKHESVLKVTWKVDDPDNDQLRYRVTFRREGQNVWRDVLRADEVLTKSEVEWDTQALPEGKYRLRVEASDELANPPEQVQKHTLESVPVLVDNTPPVFQTLTLNGRRLRARIVDGVGPVARVEVTIDGRLEWRPLAAADGVFDSPDESVDTDVSSLVPPGPHIVAVRAFDQAGNSVVQEIESR